MNLIVNRCAFEMHLISNRCAILVKPLEKISHSHSFNTFLFSFSLSFFAESRPFVNCTTFIKALRMSEKHVISFSLIHEYFKDNGAQLKRGENAYESGHVINMLYDPTVEPPIIKGAVMGSMRKKEYAVEINLRGGEIDYITCSCPRGKEVCHHMAAFALYCHYNISVTDKSCVWNVPKKAEEGNVKKIDELFTSKTFSPVNRICSAEEIQKFQGQLNECHVVGFSWLLRPETTRQFLTLLPHIEELIFSSKFNESSDRECFFTEKCKLSKEEILNVEKNTMGQSINENWLVARKHRLTASKFGGVLNACSRNKYPPSLFKNLMEGYDLNSVRAVQWGRENEREAIEVFQKTTDLDVRPSGLWMHECGYLGASPDGLIGDNALLEVKCPFKFRDTSLCEALKDNKYVIFVENNDIIINKKHNYYHRIQGQLYICKRQQCYLIIWTPSEHCIVIIEKDEEWGENIKILKKFYLEKVLAYIFSMKN